MKIIFLDIDGVLNHANFLYHRANIHELAKLHPDDAIDPACMAHLNDLIRQTGAKVVVSSTWRLRKTAEELQCVLDAKGFEGEVISKTTDADLGCRGDQIAEWIRRHEVDLFVILDDDSDMGDLWDCLVRTDFRDGLKAEHVERAVKMLEGDQ